MRKIIASVLAVLMLIGLLAGCASGTPEPDGDDGRLRIVTTVFPAYDWIRNILGSNPGNADVIWLLDGGVDLHSYQPSAADILAISTCDMFVYVGGTSDGWAAEVMRNPVNGKIKAVSLLDALGDAARVEETVEGMQEENEPQQEKEEYDEHVWLSLRNAENLVKELAGELQKMDPDHAEQYAENAAAYCEKLHALDIRYQEEIDGASVRTLLVADRFPFRYLTEDYGLTYFAAFSGCSAETEASFQVITFLADKVDELGLHAVVKTEGGDGKIAETVVQNTATKDQQILTMDSMQSITGKDEENGTTYYSVMEENLSVLARALR